MIGDIKHYAVNDQESGRNEVDSIISKRAMRESDLLAFEIGVGIADPGAVMCSYNAVNGVFGCENKYLLTDVLKKEWGFKGFVVSDWGGTHSTVKASAAGLDNEEPLDEFFGAKLKAAVEAGKVSMAELDEHVRRVLRSEFATGIVDFPMQKGVPDIEGNLAAAQKVEEQSAVLLKNKGLLPLECGSCALDRSHWASCERGHDVGRRVGAGRCSGQAFGRMAGASVVPAIAHKSAASQIPGGERAV